MWSKCTLCTIGYRPKEWLNYNTWTCSQLYYVLPRSLRLGKWFDKTSHLELNIQASHGLCIPWKKNLLRWGPSDALLHGYDNMVQGVTSLFLQKSCSLSPRVYDLFQLLCLTNSGRSGFLIRKRTFIYLILVTLITVTPLFLQSAFLPAFIPTA